MVEHEHTPVSVEDKRAVIVGGTSGIGQAIALGFAAEGADVVATSRDEDRVARTATAIEDRGVRTIRTTCDVTDMDSLNRVCEATVDTLGGIDVVVASQGEISRAPLQGVSQDDWNSVTDVVLDGVRRVTQAMVPTMEAGGSIVTISSLAARLSMANVPAYTAAKGGVEAFVRASAKELAPEIRANAIAPGFVITPQNADVYGEGTEKRAAIDDRTPLGRVADREEIVGAAVYLASDASSYTTGEVLTVDGGFANSAL